MKPHSVKVEGLSTARLEVRAKSIRRILGIGELARIDGLAVSDTLDGIKVPVGNGLELPLNFDTFEPNGEDLARSKFCRLNGEFLIELDEDTYEGLEERDGRALFSLCHELIHIFVHSLLLLQLAFRPNTALARSPKKLRPFEDSEWQADTGAAALIMPAKTLYRLEEVAMLTPQVLALETGASRESAGYRIETYRKRKVELLKIR